jgi:hypothetical protein
VIWNKSFLLSGLVKLEGLNLMISKVPLAPNYKIHAARVSDSLKFLKPINASVCTTELRVVGELAFLCFVLISQILVEA